MSWGFKLERWKITPTAIKPLQLNIKQFKKDWELFHPLLKKYKKDYTLFLSKPILLTGYGGSGKSTVASQYEKDGYYKIETDQIIYKIIRPKFGNMRDDDLPFFEIYKDDFLNPNKLTNKDKQGLLDAREYFIQYIVEKIKRA